MSEMRINHDCVKLTFVLGQLSNRPYPIEKYQYLIENPLFFFKSLLSISGINFHTELGGVYPSFYKQPDFRPLLLFSTFRSRSVTQIVNAETEREREREKCHD